MYLAPVAALREEYGFDDMLDINTAIGGALDTAEALLSSRLGTPFAAGTFTDTFFVYDPGYTIGDHNQTSFRLRRGFVTALTTALSAELYTELADGTDLASVMQHDDEKGVMTDFQTAYNRTYVQFVYTAGFDPDESIEEMYDQAQVPSWLISAANLQAKILLANSSEFKNASIEIDVRATTMQLNAILAQHVRYTPTAKLPM